MIQVGVIGIGMMGLTHLDVYRQRANVKVIAVADRDEGRRTGKAAAQGNIEGQSQGGFDFSSVRQYEDANDLINDPDVHVVDICLPTPLHLVIAKAALAAGKHVIVEKPLARTAAEARELAEAAKGAAGLSFCAMCMRYWPGWTWLKQAVEQSTYGPVKAATFRRVAQFPGGPFYENGNASGGAILDLHIHDSDFIQHLFGMPTAVTSYGYSKQTSAIDHVVTHYHYEDIPVVVAEGGWAMAPGFGFKMQYTVNFEQATAVFDLGAESPLTLYRNGQAAETIPLEGTLGYELELDDFLSCIQTQTPATRVTLADAAESVRLIEAELESVRSGQTIQL